MLVILFLFPSVFDFCPFKQKTRETNAFQYLVYAEKQVKEFPTFTPTFNFFLNFKITSKPSQKCLHSPCQLLFLSSASNTSHPSENCRRQIDDILARLAPVFSLRSPLILTFYFIGSVIICQLFSLSLSHIGVSFIERSLVSAQVVGFLGKWLLVNGL